MAEVAAQAELPRERGRSQPGARRAQSKSPGKSPGKTPRSAEQDQAAQAGLDLLRVLGWLVVHDVALADRPEVAADHVVVGPSGVYVVNNTPWVGPVTFRQGMLIANGAPRTDEIDEVAATADAVRKVLGGVPVAGVLCLIHSESVAGVAGEVAVCSTENILDLLTNQPSVIDGATQQRVARALTAAMTSGGPRPVSAPVVALPSAKHRHRPRLRLRRTTTEEIAEDFEALEEVAGLEVAPEVAAPVVQAPPPPPLASPPPPVVRAPAAPPKEERPQAESVDAAERERLEAVRREAAEERRRAVIAERRAQEERALFEAERKNVDEAREQARIEQQRQQEELQAERRRAAEERAQVEAERASTTEERASIEAERAQAAEERARIEAERASAAEERARVEAEREKADEAREEARLERQRLADQLAADRQSVAEQQERAETERRKAEAERRKAAEDQERVNVERARVAEDRRLAEQAQAKALAERKRAVEERRQAEHARARAEAEGKKAARERADAEREAAKRVAADRAASARIEAARQAEVARSAETATTPTPVSSFTATVPAPAEVENTREPRRTLRNLLPAMIAAVVIVVVVAVVPRVPGWVEWGQGLVGSDPAPAFGTTVPVEQSAFHPTLQLFAGAPARTQATAGSVPAGTQLVAIRLRLENAGADKWAVALSNRLVATDSLGVQYHVARGITAVKAGRLFAPTVKVNAQAKAAGFVTFAVPSGRSITGLELQLSSDKGDTVAWGTGQ